MLKDLGEHPDGGKIEVLSGKYGPYVSHNKVNATLPKGKEPADLSVEEAIQLLVARAEKMAEDGPKPKRGGAKPKAKAAPKAAVDKPAAKAGGAKKVTKKKQAEAAE